MSYPKPWVRKLRGTPLWEACVTRGFSGNYETEYQLSRSWREAFDWAYGAVKEWRRR